MRHRNWLIVAKSIERRFTAFVRALCAYLVSLDPDLKLYIDSRLEGSPLPSSVSYWNPQFCADRHEIIDLIITLGGDGTVLYTSWLFQQSCVPPLMPFYMGSLGFLTDFSISDIKETLQKYLELGSEAYSVHQRMRLSVTVFRHQGRRRTLGSCPEHFARSNVWDERIGPDDADQANEEVELSLSVDALVDELSLRRPSRTANGPPLITPATPPSRSSTRQTLCAVPVETFHVLNEVVLDRGPSAYMSQLELFVGGNALTVVQADGLVLSTPTGSTAYSVCFLKNIDG